MEKTPGNMEELPPTPMPVALEVEVQTDTSGSSHPSNDPDTVPLATDHPVQATVQPPARPVIIRLAPSTVGHPGPSTVGHPIRSGVIHLAASPIRDSPTGEAIPPRTGDVLQSTIGTSIPSRGEQRPSVSGTPLTSDRRNGDSSETDTADEGGSDNPGDEHELSKKRLKLSVPEDECKVASKSDQQQVLAVSAKFEEKIIDSSETETADEGGSGTDNAPSPSDDETPIKRQRMSDSKRDPKTCDPVSDELLESAEVQKTDKENADPRYIDASDASDDTSSSDVQPSGDSVPTASGNVVTANTDGEIPSRSSQSTQPESGDPVPSTSSQSVIQEVRDPVPSTRGQSVGPEVRDPVQTASGQSVRPKVRVTAPLTSGQSVRPKVRVTAPLTSGQSVGPEVRDPVQRASGQSVRPKVRVTVPSTSGQSVGPEIGEPLPSTSGQSVRPKIRDPGPSTSGQSVGPEVSDPVPSTRSQSVIQKVGDPGPSTSGQSVIQKVGDPGPSTSGQSFGQAVSVSGPSRGVLQNITLRSNEGAILNPRAFPYISQLLEEYIRTEPPRGRSVYLPRRHVDSCEESPDEETHSQVEKTPRDLDEDAVRERVQRVVADSSAAIADCERHTEFSVCLKVNAEKEVDDCQEVIVSMEIDSLVAMNSHIRLYRTVLRRWERLHRKLVVKIEIAKELRRRLEERLNAGERMNLDEAEEIYDTIDKLNAILKYNEALLRCFMQRSNFLDTIKDKVRDMVD